MLGTDAKVRAIRAPSMARNCLTSNLFRHFIHDRVDLGLKGWITTNQYLAVVQMRISSSHDQRKRVAWVERDLSHCLMIIRIQRHSTLICHAALVTWTGRLLIILHILQIHREGFRGYGLDFSCFNLEDNHFVDRSAN